MPPVLESRIPAGSKVFEIVGVVIAFRVDVGAAASRRRIENVSGNDRCRKSRESNAARMTM